MPWFSLTSHSASSALFASHHLKKKMEKEEEKAFNSLPPGSFCDAH